MNKLEILNCEECPIRQSRVMVSDTCGITDEVIPHHQVYKENRDWREDQDEFPPWCPLPLQINRNE